MIKAIIFDFGNVIYKLDNRIFLKKISPCTDLKINDLEKRIYHESDLCLQYESGKIDSDEFFNGVCSLVNLSITKEDFIKAYTGIFTPVPLVIDLIRKLNRNFRLALLSNTSEWDYEYCIKKSSIYFLFEVVALSYKIKVLKPDPRIFFHVLDRLRFRPSECLYIDDKAEYVRAAKMLKINGLQYKSGDLLKKDLKRKFGINC